MNPAPARSVGHEIADLRNYSGDEEGLYRDKAALPQIGK